MSMYPQELGPIPTETMRVARAAYPKGSLAMRLRDELGGLYRDEEFLSLFDRRGQPAEARLSLSRGAGAANGRRPHGPPSR